MTISPQDCIVQKAEAESNWTAGGLYSPANLSTTNPQINTCWLVIKLTSGGWEYDPKVTNPTSGDGPCNCDPKNVTTVKTFR